MDAGGLTGGITAAFFDRYAHEYDDRNSPDHSGCGVPGRPSWT
ncbi:hypothetical protein [Micromonospora sp. ATA51]|nr:hypothetical protein [Micromonospora sp. ATA51]